MTVHIEFLDLSTTCGSIPCKNFFFISCYDKIKQNAQ